MPVMTLLKSCVARLECEFAIDVAISALRLFHALINGNNEINESNLVSDRIYDPISVILNLGYYRNGKYQALIYENSKEKENAKEGEEAKEIKEDIIKVFDDNRKINDIKYWALMVAIALINPSNKHEFTNSISLSILDSMLKLGYAQTLSYSNAKLKESYFNPSSNV